MANAERIYLAKLGQLDGIKGKEAKIVFFRTHALAVDTVGNLIGVPQSALSNRRRWTGPRQSSERMREIFAGQAAHTLYDLRAPTGKVSALGPCYEIEYTSYKYGERHGWVHEFDHPRPVVFQHGAGRSAWYIFQGGRYRLTAAGIEK